MDLLRVLTAGSVDDGKSSLIGRMLVDSDLVFEDHLDALRKASGKTDRTDLLDFALLELQAQPPMGLVAFGH